MVSGFFIQIRPPVRIFQSEPNHKMESMQRVRRIARLCFELDSWLGRVVLVKKTSPPDIPVILGQSDQFFPPDLCGNWTYQIYSGYSYTPFPAPMDLVANVKFLFCDNIHPNSGKISWDQNPSLDENKINAETTSNRYRTSLWGAACLRGLFAQTRRRAFLAYESDPYTTLGIRGCDWARTRKPCRIVLCSTEVWLNWKQGLYSHFRSWRRKILYQPCLNQSQKIQSSSPAQDAERILLFPNVTARPIIVSAANCISIRSWGWSSSMTFAQWVKAWITISSWHEIRWDVSMSFRTISRSLQSAVRLSSSRLFFDPLTIGASRQAHLFWLLALGPSFLQSPVFCTKHPLREEPPGMVINVNVRGRA
jgi:hypothetical protein